MCKWYGREAAYLDYIGREGETEKGSLFPGVKHLELGRYVISVG